MKLTYHPAPNLHHGKQTNYFMKQVLIALLPAIVVSFISFGYGRIFNIIWCSVVAIICEAGVLLIRRRSPLPYISDSSALITAWLIALSLPGFAPWWLGLIGTAFAIIIGKQLYGGLGYNPFNPAMVGYTVLLVSFPLEMSTWPSPKILINDVSAPSLLNQFFIFTGQLPILDDTWTTATPLDIIRSNTTLTLVELWNKYPILSGLGGIGSFSLNVSFLIGGIYLLYNKIISWHAPIGMLASLLILSFIFQGGTGSSSTGSPLFHLFSGATMMGAFFIITDPVSGATSKNGRLLFGVAVGSLTYIIRIKSSYPDGLAFATLLINITAPTIDYYTKPRTFGHHKKNNRIDAQNKHNTPS